MKQFFYSVVLVLTALILFTGCQKEEANTPSIPKFQVTFDSQGGSDVDPMSVEKGQKITKPANPTYGEYIFADWYKEANYTTKWDFDKDVVEKDITLYAKWETVSFTVTFNTNGGSAIAPLTVAKGSAAVMPIAPTKNGVAFENWYKEAALTTVYDFSAAVNADMTLYAKWVTVKFETLQDLLESANQLSRDNYTRESYDAMRLKGDAANLVLHNEHSTSAQLVTAYTELSAAMNALVALPKRDVVGIRLFLIDGIAYVVPAKRSFFMYTTAVDATGGLATDPRVTFEYDAVKLAQWAEGEIMPENDRLCFAIKSDITPGQTISMTIKSVDNPSIYKTLTLKVAGEGEMRAKFLVAVNALPAPDKISYEDREAIYHAIDIYFVTLVSQDYSYDAVKEGHKKLMACQKALENLPVRLKYSFKGNVCTMIDVDDVDELRGDFTYVADGAFPAGTYTQNGWVETDVDEYQQVKLTLKADGSGVRENRIAKDAKGTGATAWEEEVKLTSYTYTGTQAAGGVFSIKFLWF